MSLAMDLGSHLQIILTDHVIDIVKVSSWIAH